MQRQAVGYRDAARNEPMRVDAIFQIYSMTKPITSVAALLLLEEGRLQLDDPVSRFIPEFSGKAITIRHLLTHTAGFAAGEKLSGPAVDRLNDARLYELPTLAAYATGLAALPLANEPGTRFSYDGVNTEVLARVIEVASATPFDEFVRKRVLVPLRMVDTDFSVPPGKRSRIVEMTSTDEVGRLVKASGGPKALGDRLKRYPSGAGGLYSTADDYARFCQMLLNGGELDGVRILSRKTVQLMMSNQLTFSPPVNEFNDGEGFGLGGYVVLDPVRRGQLGSVGQFGWSGAAATWFTIDPKERLITILLMQHLPQRLHNDPPRLGRPFNNLVYQAATGAADRARKIVLIGGMKSEAPGRHDYPKGIRVLERLLTSSPDLLGVAGLVVAAHPNGWPSDQDLDGASTVVWYFDGVDKHPLLAAEHRARFEALMKAGVGLVTLHQASTVPSGDQDFDLPRWLGGARLGMFDRATEMAEVALVTPAHPVSRGLAPVTYLDEFYPTIRWRSDGDALKPILEAQLHVEAREGKDLVLGEPVTATVAWVYERADGGRAFAFTGGHYLAALDQPSVRKMILNAIAWTARIEVPFEGIRSQYPDAAKEAVGEAVVTRAANAQVIPQPWGKLTWYVSGELGNSETMTVGEAVIKPGQQNPRHYHPNCDEVLHVVRGRILHTMGTQQAEMTAGDTVSIPMGVRHNARNIGTEDAVLAISFSSAHRQVIGE